MKNQHQKGQQTLREKLLSKMSHFQLKQKKSEMFTETRNITHTQKKKSAIKKKDPKESQTRSY